MDQEAEMQCPRCGKRFELTSEYLAQYAGMLATCECGEELTVPEASASPQEAVALSYAAPTHSWPQPRGVWCDGSCVVVARGTRMADRCCVCNTPVEGTRPKTLRWIPPEHRYRSRHPLFFLIQSAIADSYSQSIVVRIGRCREHRREFKPVLVGWSLIMAGFVGLPLVASLASVGLVQTIGLISALALLVSGAIILLIPPRIRIQNFRENCAWLRGFGEPYLNALPSLADAHEKTVGNVADALQQVDHRS
jgi:hypothetical protein